MAQIAYAALRVLILDPVLADFRARAELGKPAFVGAHPTLFLLRTAPEMVESDPFGDQFSFVTHVEGMDEDDEDSEAGWVIAPIKKREGGPFPDRIGIGRARNCDVVLRFASVSKLHAQLRTGAALELVDLGSANGTAVNGVALAPRTPQPVELGDRLLIGAVEVELVDAAALFDRLG